MAEEFPSGRSGRALGTLLTSGVLGTIAVGFPLGAGLQKTGLEWRAFYLVGLFPVLVLSLYRRRRQETNRFLAAKAGRGNLVHRGDFLAPWRTASRRNLVLVGLVHTLRSVPLFGATAWWAFDAERERGFSSGEVACYIICAYGLGTLDYACGRAIERLGRRPVAMTYRLGAIAFGALLAVLASLAVRVAGRPPVEA